MRCWDPCHCNFSDGLVISSSRPLCLSFPFLEAEVRAVLMGWWSVQCTGRRAQRGSWLGSVLCCHCFVILNNFVFMLLFCKWGLTGQWNMCVNGRDMLGGSMCTCSHVPTVTMGAEHPLTWWTKAHIYAWGLSGGPQGSKVAGPGPGPRLVAMMVLQPQK